MKKHEKFLFKEITTDPGQEPLRIDKFLMSKLYNVSRNRIQKACQKDYILVDDMPVKSNYKLKPGQTIKFYLPKEFDHNDIEVVPTKMDLDIIYEDDTVMVINKPAGLVVHPGVGNREGTLIHGLKYHFKGEISNELDDIQNRFGLVHRIDKDTTGLLVIAKTVEALSHLTNQFMNKTTKREYHALVWGNFDEMTGTITGNIGRHPKEPFKRHVFVDGDQGKHAVTHYEVLEDLYYVSLVKCVLETGRTHQIRVHMAHKKHPLFGDVKYGGDRIMKGTVFTKYKQFVHNALEVMPRQALHAHTLGFVHPKTLEHMDFTVELPSDFKLALDKWRHYVEHKKETV